MPALRDIAEKGLLSSRMRHAHEAYFDPEEIDRFLADHLPSKDAVEMLASRYRSQKRGIGIGNLRQ